MCEGFNEETGMAFPSCAPGLRCVSTGLLSTGGGGGKICLKVYQGEG